MFKKISFIVWKLGYYISVIYNKIKFKLLLGGACSFDLVVAGTINIRMSKNTRITIGKQFHSLSGNFYNGISNNSQGSIQMDEGGTLIIGNRCGMSSTTIRCKTKITLGDNVNLGADVMLLDTDCHSIDYMDRRTRSTDDVRNTKSKPIIIEDDVLVGARSIVMKGVTIGARSVIGAGSVVTRSIPTDSIAAGNPCRIIKKIEHK